MSGVPPADDEGGDGATQSVTTGCRVDLWGRSPESLPGEGSLRAPAEFGAAELGGPTQADLLGLWQRWWRLADAREHEGGGGGGKGGRDFERVSWSTARGVRN